MAKKDKNADSAKDAVIDKEYIAQMSETAQMMNDLVKPIPLEAILFWINAHSDDEEVIETVNRFTFLHTKKYKMGRWAK